MKSGLAKVSVLVLFWALFVFLDHPANCATGFSSFPETRMPGSATEPDLLSMELPVPDQAGKTYLGVSGPGGFRLGEIDADVLIVEIFSLYCPHCQRMASRVNDLYREMEKQPPQGPRVKMIGIGVSNTAFEVEMFQKRYDTPFPLFPDKSMEISGRFGARGTPTFVGLRLRGEGPLGRFYWEEGGFEDATVFLQEILRLSGFRPQRR
ncbi:MAG: redoxin [Deltaproteobacteria bacterium HGW-Deltaproteobacteria-19]|jgi:thiol-disulfide isomerase/thioredoxin|nr:MAG: redoxin [Deltaproteobacteria bacterium HGW-Deltaproteobacteria-19]